MIRALLVAFTMVCLYGCSNFNQHYKEQRLIEYVNIQEKPINFYIDKTTEQDIINALGSPIDRIEYFDNDEYWDFGYPNCYESGSDTVKHVKLTYNGSYKTINEIDKNHVQVVIHKIYVTFHHLNEQIITQTYNNKFSLIIHNGKLRGVPKGPDGNAITCVFIDDHRKQ